jgi:ABC-type transport system involved in multi-copper enzyme maturation permease subunit
MSSGFSQRPAAPSPLAAALRSLWQDVLGALWRLGPGNPIADRTVSTASKRTRHFYIRLAYVGILLLIAGVNFMQVTGRPAGLAELAKLNSQTFAYVSFAQLLMMCLLAPVFAAGAVQQQRDADTFNVLLTTPLTNGQIVLGTLFGRLFFVMALLVSGLPVFLLTMLYGGVTSREILLSFSLSAAAGLAMASLAICVGLFGVGARQGVFSFYIMVGFYLVAGIALAQFFPVSAAPTAAIGTATANIHRMPIYAWAHPVLALMAVLGITPPPAYGAVADLPWPFPFLLSRPAEGFIATALAFSVLLTITAMFAVRRGSRQGEGTWLSRLIGEMLSAKIPGSEGEVRRRLRYVWHNPVAWREAVARAATPSQRAMRWFIFIAGTIAAVILLLYWHSIPGNQRGALQPQMQAMLTAALVIEVVVAMVAVASAAGTAITRDRENGTFELMQATPLTSRYILAGKLRGLVTLSAPLLAVPTVTALLFALVGLASKRSAMLISPASPVVIPLVLLTHIAVVAMIGMHISLRQRNTTKAVLMSVGFTLGIYLPLTLMCLGAGSSWSVFTVLNPIMFIYGCVNTEEIMGASFVSNLPAEILLMFLTAAIGSALILIVVWQGYVSMVKNFDFTLRRQT